MNASDKYFEGCNGLDDSIECLQDLQPSDTVVTIDGTGHCRDMYAPNSIAKIGIPDTAAVQWAHQVIANDVARYIGDDTPQK